jgi:hypothetical protein
MRIIYQQWRPAAKTYDQSGPMEMKAIPTPSDLASSNIHLPRRSFSNFPCIRLLDASASFHHQPKPPQLALNSPSFFPLVEISLFDCVPDFHRFVASHLIFLPVDRSLSATFIQGR